MDGRWKIDTWLDQHLSLFIHHDYAGVIGIMLMLYTTMSLGDQLRTRDYGVDARYGISTAWVSFFWTVITHAQSSAFLEIIITLAQLPLSHIVMGLLEYEAFRLLALYS